MIRIYYRVSTGDQDFKMQDHAIRLYLENRGISYESCMIYQDFGISGTKIQRPEYQRLLSEVVEHDTVLAYEWSRLWRDMEEQSRVTKMFLVLDITLSSVIEGDIKTEDDTLNSDIRGVINQHEARRIRRRSREGIKALQDKCAKGEAVWNGRGPDKKKRNNEGYKRRWEKERGYFNERTNSIPLQKKHICQLYR